MGGEVLEFGIFGASSSGYGVPLEVPTPSGNLFNDLVGACLEECSVTRT